MAGGNLKLQVLLSAIDRTSGPLKRITGGSSATSKALRATQSELKRLEGAQRDITGFRKLDSQLGSTSNQLVQAQRELRRLGIEVNAADTPSKKLTASLKKQGEAVGRLRELESRHRATLAASRHALEAAGISTTRLAVHERQLQTNIESANRALEGQRRRLGQLAAAQARMNRMHSAGMKLAAHGAGAVAAGSVAARGIGAPVAAYANQEDAATQLRASMMTAGGKVGPEFAQIDALAQKLGNRLPGTTADFYEMMTMLRRQGMSAKVILGGLGEATGYLGVQLKMGYSEAAEFAAKLQDATRTSEGDMMALSDVIQRTFYLGVDSENMLQGFSKLSSSMDVLKTSGIDAARMFAPLLVMADQAGMKGEAAGNAYRKVFQGAMDAGKMAKANALIAGSGIKLDFTNGKGEFGGLDQMFVQLKKLEKLNTQDRLAVTRKMFGDDAETLQAVSLMISKGADGYAQVQGKMATQASLQERVNSQLGTLKNLWDAASGTFVNGLAAMGEAVAPDLKNLTEWIGKVAERFQTWAKENPGLAGGLFKVAAVLTGLVIAAGGLALAVGTVLMPFAGLNFVLTNLGVNTAPLLTRFWSLAGKVLPAVAGAIRMVGTALITNPIGIVLMLLAGAAYLIWKNWGTIGPMLTGIWNSVAAGVSAAWDWLKAKAGALWEFLKGVFAWSPLGILITHWDAILGFLGGLWTRFKDIGGQLMQGLIGGLLGGLKAVGDTITSIGGKVVDWFKGKLGIHSPSRVFAQLGGYTMDGLAGGLQRGQRAPLRQIDSLGQRMRQAGAGLAIAAAATPAAAIDNRAPMTAATAASSAVGSTYHITINAAAGAQAQDIATLVRQEIERIEREKGARTRSRLGDYGND